MRNIKFNNALIKKTEKELRDTKFSQGTFLKSIKNAGFVEIRPEKPGIRTFLFPESYKRLYIKCINDGHFEIREGFRFSKSRVVNL